MKQQHPKPPPQAPRRTEASSTYAEIASRNEDITERTRIPNRRRTPKFDQQAYIKETVRALLPEILVPLIKILIEVTSIPGDCKQKIARANEVAQEAIQNACEIPELQEGYTTEEDDQEYEPTEPGVSEDSHHTDDETFSDAELPANRPILTSTTQDNRSGPRSSQRNQRSTH